MNVHEWKWEHRNGEPVILSPGGMVYRVQVQTLAGTWDTNSAVTGIVAEAMTEYEQLLLQRSFSRGASPPQLFTWETERLSFNMADVIAVSARGGEHIGSLWVHLRHSHDAYTIEKNERAKFMAHWRQYQQWRHVNQGDRK